MTDDWYFAPNDIVELAALLRDRPDAILVAGGTDLMPRIRNQNSRFHDTGDRTFVSLRRIASLERIESTNDHLSVGAGATHARLARSSVVESCATALGDVAAAIGSPAIREWGTLGGTLANASRSMDVGPVLLALDATIKIMTAEGTRLQAFQDFVRGPRRSTLQAGEAILGVTIPPAPFPSGSAFAKQCVRNAMDIAIATAAVHVTLGGDGNVVGCVLAVGNVGPAPFVLSDVSATLVGRSVDDAVRLVAAAVESAVTIDGDDRVPDDYRRAVCGVLAARALSRAAERATRR